MMLEQMRNKIAQLLSKYSPEMSLVLAACGWFLSFGFFLGHTNNNYTALTDLMSFTEWGILFLLYAVVKSFRVLSSDTQNWIDIATSSVGIWAWNYIFLSFTLFDKVPTAPTEFLLFIPVLGEAWALTSIIYQKDLARSTRNGC